MKGKKDMAKEVSSKEQMLGRRDFLTGAAAVAMAGGAGRAQADMPPGRFEMTVINPEVVSGGAGLCVIMRTPAGKTYLFDAANGDDKKSNGKDIIIPWLEKRGISRIDGLILSHYHSDHFGGLLYLLDHFEIAHIFDNSFEPLNAYGSAEVDTAKRHLFNWERKHPGMVTRYLVEGDKLGWDEPGVKFDVVWPPKTGYCVALERGPDYKRNGSTHHLLNANSTGLRIRVGEVDYLILGDINADYVAEYMRPYMEHKGTWKANVVVLHCHGIPDDKGANIAAMKPLPEVAIASLGNLKWMCGSGRASVGIYSKMGIKAYSTNVHGDVSVSSNGHAIDVSTDSTKLYPQK
jgi:competence protein ComEC